jgi:hypothetical protein
MTAYELADIQAFKTEELTMWERNHTAVMLRQQANRIEVLEANHKIQVNINEKALQYIDHLEQGLRASIDLNRAQAKREQEK